MQTNHFESIARPSFMRGFVEVGPIVLVLPRLLHQKPKMEQREKVGQLIHHAFCLLPNGFVSTDKVAQLQVFQRFGYRSARRQPQLVLDFLKSKAFSSA